MIDEPLNYLLSLNAQEFVRMFWHTLFIEIPRYLLPGALIALGHASHRPRRTVAGGPTAPRVSVLLPGHNESARLELAVQSMRLQSRPPDQIIVIDDGSTDGMGALARRLKREGAIDLALSTRLRGGKSAAANLGLGYATGEVVVIADVDTTYDDDAFERLVAPFDDPACGAVSGNLGVRNWNEGLIARWQTIQYLLSISLGRRVTDMLGILYIVSGAFGAFRRTALEQVGGWDVGPGEDADITVKLRQAGWRVQFAPEAWALTDAPETLTALVRQRLRWNRSLVRIRLRKFGRILNPRRDAFLLRNAMGVLDVLFFQVVLAASFLSYLIWLFWTYGSFAWIAVAAVSMFYVGLGTIGFLAACAVSGDYGRLRLLPEAMTYGLFNSYFLRFVRLYAALDELIYRHSYDDDYVPQKVRERTEVY
ncbi:MAG: glycosyltransferase family 2 protein [Alphaproteobacteria bacterium]|nr:glycosyltransferase family 2 protein [Alphaproteobacteria bacterium]